jgi:hypothetical protein
VQTFDESPRARFDQSKGFVRPVRIPLRRNDLHGCGRIGPASVHRVSHLDGKGFDSGSHVGRNTQVNVKRPLWAAACRALGKYDFRGTSKDAQIRLDGIGALYGEFVSDTAARQARG